ncbi:hypothetical protein HELRODRAFT_183706 [Helobdella robusta]|uniref:Uncharacterized protein n=1 Tax=Helobdella robusta TaxID=6412 RepID=T1FK31_HELRO|nr:hypothetical protein HELRODRAFT_183706 [Helobdella robusta]ESO10381.1 hypothetical protein HELRODRAFT_183706 [Helobdella robusta]
MSGKRQKLKDYEDIANEVISLALEQLPFRGGANRTVKSDAPTNSCNKTFPTWMSTGFLSTGRTIPAILLRCLFLKAEIESNPTRCRTCYNWHHLNNCTTNINSYYYCNKCPRPSTKSGKSTAPIDTSRRPTSTSASLNNNCLRDKTSTTQATNAGQLNFLQLNCNGIKNKHEEIQQHLIDHNIPIAALQES